MPDDQSQTQFISEAIDSLRGSIGRLQNVSSVGSGSAQKPSMVAGLDILPVSFLAASKVSNPVAEATKIQVTWLAPEENRNRVDRFNVYLQVIGSTAGAPILAASVADSPCTFIALNDGATLATVAVQTVLANGYSNPANSLPTTTVAL